MHWWDQRTSCLCIRYNFMFCIVFNLGVNFDEGELIKALDASANDL